MVSRRPRPGLGLALLIVLSAPALRAQSSSDPGSTPPSLLERIRAGRDLLDGVPAVAGFDGAWSIATQLDTLLVARRWDAPYPQGLVAQEATRILFGTSWATMIAAETAAASLASGGRFDWIGELHYRTDWIFGVDSPACPRPGAFGGCGVGIGSFGGLHVRPAGSSLWYEVTGGWLEQRVATDARRTLEESAWVLTPLSVTQAASAASGPLALGLRIGPGAYFGMHSAHLHPTEAGKRTLEVPWHELYPLDVGVGPGMRGDLSITIARSVRIAGGFVVAPLVLGTRRTHVTPELAPLAAGGRGVPWWRAGSVGVTIARPGAPLRFGLALFGAELSTRPLEQVGHLGCMLHFDFPLRPVREP